MWGCKKKIANLFLTGAGIANCLPIGRQAICKIQQINI
jgi:hypothetical protein